MISHWFTHINDIIQTYKIEQKNTYNMDKKKFGISLFAESLF